MQVARALGFHLADGERGLYRRLVAEMLPTYARLNQLDREHAQAAATRRHWRPGPEDNPNGGWYVRTLIEPTGSGPLNGKSVALKDNISVAGVPMAIGTSLLEGYVADVDATVVARLLAAGATITGKAACESSCLSGGSHTSFTGPVRNPHNPAYSAGGSSSGNGALLAGGEVDLGIGGDQGGSIRIPSSWCGVFGLKPTYGLVPYSGIVSLDVTLDHAGPMARSAEDVASLLDAIAGPDGLDPRQVQGPPPSYRAGLGGDLAGLRIGVLAEGFGWPRASQADVDEAVRESAAAFQKLGCRVEPVSIPWHLDGYHVHTGLLAEGCVMPAENAMGTNWKGLYLTSLLDAYVNRHKQAADELPDNVKHYLMTGQYMRRVYGGRYYAISQNLRRSLAAAYDEAFKSVDILVMPTTTYKAEPLPAADATVEERIACTGGMEFNACPFNVTGHPALNVPCAFSAGLPIGMMLVGRLDEDGALLRAAHQFQERVYAPSFPQTASAGASS